MSLIILLGLILMFFIAAGYFFTVSKLIYMVEGEDMKSSHRSDILDHFINHNVKITFNDDSWIEGVLIWVNHLAPPRYLRAGRYYVKLESGEYMQLYKANVKIIENI